MGMAGTPAPKTTQSAHPGSSCSQVKPQGMSPLLAGASPPLLTIPSFVPGLDKSQDGAVRDSSPHPSHRNPLESLLDLMAPKISIYLSIHPRAAPCSRMFPQSCTAWGAVPAFHSAFLPLAIPHLLVFPLILPCRDGSGSCCYPLSHVLIIPCSFPFTLKEPQPLLHTLNLQLCCLRLRALLKSELKGFIDYFKTPLQRYEKGIEFQSHPEAAHAEYKLVKQMHFKNTCN